MEKTYIGVGEDGEALYCQKIHEACWLLHINGNTESPFEFSSERDVLNFAQIVGKLRMENRLEALINE